MAKFETVIITKYDPIPYFLPREGVYNIRSLRTFLLLYRVLFYYFQ